MAIYEYKCSNCDITITINRAMTEEDPGYKCKTCQNDLNKVYSIGAITFNGPGFYRTDK
jgi:putative FmdB family regulatory protein